MIMLATMLPTNSARRYLESMLPRGQWQAASHAIGHDHAYIQQYIRRGVPKWLSETDREVLVRVYPHLNPERLKPPPKRSAHVPHVSHDRRDHEADLLGVIPDDPERAELLRVWARLAGNAKRYQRRLGLNMLALLADNIIADHALAPSNTDGIDADGIGTDEIDADTMVG